MARMTSSTEGDPCEVTVRDLDAINQRITRQIETQERERLETAAHLRDLIDRDVGVPLREYVEAVMEESKRALEMAEREREKAAVALREQTEKAAVALREQTQRALDKADSEREKSAAVLRSENQRALDKADIERENAAAVLRTDLAGAIQQGDNNLRNHIKQEIERIREALQSGEKLELSRIKEIENLAYSVQRELMLVQDSAKEAIEKAEVATEKRFASVNEFRAQLASQTNTFLPREVAEAEFKEIRQSIATVVKRQDQDSGSDAGERRAKAGLTSTAMAWIAVLGLLVSVLAIAVVVILANSGQ